MSPESSWSRGGAWAPDADRRPLPWPPPGLERLHDGIWPVNARLAVGSMAMVLPMLLSLSVRGPFWSTGPLDGVWWVAGSISLIGLAILLAGLIRMVRLAVVAARAARLGYDSRTIADVACDATRDAGFLSQGLRQYGGLDARERRSLLNARLVAAAAFGASSLWAPAAFVLGVVLAGRGVIHAAALFWPVVFGPAGLLFLIGLRARIVDRVATRRAYRTWRAAGRADETVGRDAAAWLTARAAATGAVRQPAGSPLAWRFGAAGFGVLAFALPVPIVLLAVLSSVGPFTRELVAPRLTTLPAGLARTDMLRAFAIPADPEISAREAGESVHVLSWVGDPGREPLAVERRPVRMIPDAWIPDESPESIRLVGILPRRVFDEHEPLTAEEIEWLERAEAHPGHEEIARLARAASADIVDTRWDTARFAGESAWTLPIIRFSRMREGAYVHVALGVLAAERGDLELAELRFREVISMGLLLARSGPTLIDMLIGGVVARIGADALRGFYESTGRESDAANLRLAHESIDRAESVALKLGMRGPASLRGMADIAANADLPAGVRWESLMNTQLSARCHSTNAVLFGVGEDYDEWLAGVSGSLVRYPSEAALFELIGESRVQPARSRPVPRLLRSLFSLTFGESGSASRCADLAVAVASVH